MSVDCLSRRAQQKLHERVRRFCVWRIFHATRGVRDTDVLGGGDLYQIYGVVEDLVLKIRFGVPDRCGI
jgi:hypothetical protein